MDGDEDDDGEASRNLSNTKAQDVEDDDDAVDPSLPDLIDDIPAEVLIESLDRRGSLSLLKIVSSRWHAPLPPPDLLSGYEDISPGFADRIICMAEKEQSHRHTIDQTAVAGTIRGERTGQYMAFILSMLLILVGGSLIYSGHPIVGTIFGGGTMVALAVAFISGRVQSKTKKSDNKEGGDNE